MAKSQAMPGMHCSLHHSTDGTTYTPISLEITDMKGPAMSRETVEVTHYGSPNQYKEYLGALRDAGEVSVEANYTWGGYNTMKGLFDLDVPHMFMLFVPSENTGKHVEIKFEGIITELPLNMPLAEAINMACTIKIVSKPDVAEVTTV